MKTYISMLRGINVTGHNMINMADLKKLYESVRLNNARTYVQSGNVLFESNLKDDSKISGMIESQIKKAFGFEVSVFIRSADDFKRIIDTNLFLNKKNIDTSKLYVSFWRGSPPADLLNTIEVPAGITDEFIIGEGEIFLYCPGGYGNTKLSNNFFERKLKIPATTRNWNTVNALYSLATKT